MSTRTARYLGLFRSPIHMDEVLSRPILVVGCGSTGRRLLLLLAEAGFNNLTFCDPDTVGPENYGPQGYRPETINQPKVEVMVKELAWIAGGTCPGKGTVGPFEPKMILEGNSDLVVINCSDSMDVRKQLSELCAQCSLPLFDPRMACLDFQICWQIPGHPSVDEFQRSLFPQSEASETPCTLRSSPWGAAACSAVLAAIVSRFLIDGHIPDLFITCSLGHYPSMAEAVLFPPSVPQAAVESAAT